MAKAYREKICERCDSPFVPASGSQKLCNECRAKLAEKPLREPTMKELVARNKRQYEAIKRLQDEIVRLKGATLAPRQALVSQIETLEKAIARQRQMISEGQTSVAAMGQRNHALRKGIEAAIEVLIKTLNEDQR